LEKRGKIKEKGGLLEKIKIKEKNENQFFGNTKRGLRGKK